MDFKLNKKVSNILSNNNISLDNRLLELCKLLNNKIEYYNWVGFYFKNGNKNELKLGPYVGLPTEHTNIPFGKGICGQVALSNKTFVVPDVSEQSNYISCNINVKSEIVVPIIINNENVGQLDIDSNTINAFTKQDEEFLDFVCEEVGKVLKNNKYLNLIAD